MKIKKIFGQIHLWLGLASGLVVFIVAITGAIWAFETEISDWLYAHRTVEAENKVFLKPSELKAKAASYFKGKPIQSIDYLGAEKAVVLKHYSEANGKDIHIFAYLNPYSGKVLHVEDGHTFFDIVLELHVNLLLGQTGRYIVDFATLFCLILLITGIVLWWPKNKAAAKQRFKFSWRSTTQWKRKNYDLHNVLGFYASWVAVFIAITGLAWGFEWVNKTIYYTASLGAEYKDYFEPKSTSKATTAQLVNVEDRVYQLAAERYKKPFETLNIYNSEDVNGTFAVYVNESSRTFYDSDSYYFDKRTGDFISQEKFEELNNGQKIRNMYYDIHIGKILGLPGQFLVFFASLIVASLPITGTLVWWGRRKKAVIHKNVVLKTANV